MPTDFTGLINLFLGLINPLLILVTGLALLAFFKGLAAFIAKSGDSKSHADGRNLMIWGLVALFVMVSVVGIIRFAYNDLGFNSSGRSFGIPTLPTNR